MMWIRVSTSSTSSGAAVASALSAVARRFESVAHSS